MEEKKTYAKKVLHLIRSSKQANAFFETIR